MATDPKSTRCHGYLTKNCSLPWLQEGREASVRTRGALMRARTNAPRARTVFKNFQGHWSARFFWPVQKTIQRIYLKFRVRHRAARTHDSSKFRYPTPHTFFTILSFAGFCVLMPRPTLYGFFGWFRMGVFCRILLLPPPTDLGGVHYFRKYVFICPKNSGHILP